LLGHRIRPDGRRVGRAYIDDRKRPEHIAVLGKTGTGKTTLLRFFCEQDIMTEHGFIFFDLHGQVTNSLLGRITATKRRDGLDHSERVVLIDPASRSSSVGINVLNVLDEQGTFVKVAELVEVLRARWSLDSFGARTEELLRNSLLLLIQCRLTLLEIEPLLTNHIFRSECLSQARSGPASKYFSERFEPLSLPMKGVLIEPVLNKITAFSADPHIRHIIGQTYSTIDFRKVLEEGHQVIINLNKGRLGEEAKTLGSLLLTQIKSALFGRRSRRTFTIYCDEIQNLVAYDQGLESLLAEARKFGVSICSANQYLDQLTPAMRAAILSCGTQLFFQLSGRDAQYATTILGGPRSISHALRTLSRRQLVARISSSEPTWIQVPELAESQIPTIGLRSRLASSWTQKREAIEREIAERQQTINDELDGWD
jgi:hypothetical protein